MWQAMGQWDEGWLRSAGRDEVITCGKLDIELGGTETVDLLRLTESGRHASGIQYRLFDLLQLFQH